MRLRIKINDDNFISPQIIGKGFLGSHLVLSNFDEDSNLKMELDVTGYDTNNPEITEYLNWNQKEIKVGDVISIEVMPKDSFKATAPAVIKKSSENQILQLSNEQIATNVIKTILANNSALEELLKDTSSLSETESSTLQAAIAQIISANFEKVLEPIFRVFPDKRPSELKNMPL